MTIIPDRKRFAAFDLSHRDNLYHLLVADYSYWIERNIKGWLQDKSGLEYSLDGMILTFATNEDRVVFLLQWG